MKRMNGWISTMTLALFVLVSGYSLMQAKGLQGEKPGECAPPVMGDDGKPMCMLTSGCNLLNGSCKFKNNACVCEAYPVGSTDPIQIDEILRALN
jgi:hypothetical protein